MRCFSPGLLAALLLTPLLGGCGGPSSPAQPAPVPAGFGTVAAQPGAAVRMASLRTGSAATTTPGSPTNLVTSSSGGTVTLTWSPSSAGDSATSYVIEAGSAPGLANLANFSTGSTLTMFQATGVGAGTYYVRVRAANGVGVSSPSNESVLVVGGACTAPGAPGGLSLVSNAAGTVVLAWTASTGVPTTYIVEAGSSSGLSNLVNSDLGSAATTLTATGVGAGTYYVRVRAKNACGTSAPSNEQMVVVAPTGPPLVVRGTIYGHAQQGGLAPDNYQAPVSGALVSTSLDSATTVTDSSGNFTLTTQTPAAGFGCTPFTLTIRATGYPTYSRNGPWGGGGAVGTPWTIALTWDIQDPIKTVGCGG